MQMIRQAKIEDIVRLAEIEVFNYRQNFYPIFQNDWFYFNELQVPALIKHYRDNRDILAHTLVYDDGVVKGFLRVEGENVEKLFVEPILQGKGIGSKLLDYAVAEMGIRALWALEKNTKAISFYERHGFHVTGNRKFEEDTTEYLVQLQR